MPEAIIPLRKAFVSQIQKPKWELVDAMLKIGETNLVTDAVVNGLNSRYVDVRSFWLRQLAPGGVLHQFGREERILTLLRALDLQSKDADTKRMIQEASKDQQR